MASGCVGIVLPDTLADQLAASRRIGSDIARVGRDPVARHLPLG